MENTQKPSLRYAWYVVFILMLAYVSSFVDRQILSLLVKPIKRDMHLSDTEMSLLMGLSFAIFYTLLGIPIGRWADRGNRRQIIMLGIAVWSVMTALCGITKNYFQLFLARVGVGVGEAALTPAAYSMISDYFPKEKLAFALSVYSMGIYIGSGLALMVAGLAFQLASVQTTWELPLVGSIYPWQMVFFIIGLPGLLISLLIFTIREPIRTQKRMIKTESGESIAAQVSLKEVLTYINANRQSFLGISLGLACTSLAGYATSAWYPTVLQRVFGWSEVASGFSYGLMVAVFATTGAGVGGSLADKFKKKGNPNANIRICMIAATGVVLSAPLFLLMPTGALSVAFVGLPSFFTGFPIGAAAAAIQEMMPNQMRALASAIYFFILNIIAISLGPMFTALLTDYWFANENMVHYSLLIVAIFANIAALICLYSAQKSYTKSLQYLENYMEK
ncbi:MAG: MFS transporter [Cytophagales bacterium]|nr:MAG: MFS transporter [Cytophagales bacterium]